MGKSHKSEKKLKKKHKHKERKEKKKAKKLKKRRENLELTKDTKLLTTTGGGNETDFAIPLDLMNSKSHAPETPTEYQQRQNRIRREVDPSTGRARLIKGDGEVLEEIVTKDRHKAINKEATRSDGDYFEVKTLGKSK